MTRTKATCRMAGNTRKDCNETGRIGKNWIPKSKAKCFQTLFKEMADHLGGRMAAKKYAGLSGCLMSGLSAGKISEDTAKRIFDAYKKLKPSIDRKGE